MGVLYLQSGDLSNAISNLEKALEFQPDFDEPLYHLGLAYMQKGNKEMAFSYFTKFKISPSYYRLTNEKKAMLEKYLSMCYPGQRKN